jgi:hypothetical protein
MNWFRMGIAAALVALLGGCGQPRSQVHGTVHYKGKPLSAGTIVFLAPDNQAYPVRIQPDGSYQVASLPRGRVRVAVQAATPRLPSRPQPGAKDSDGLATDAAKTDDAAKRRRKPLSTTPAVTFPSRYGNPEQSGLDFDLQAPDQEYSIDLK